MKAVAEDAITTPVIIVTNPKAAKQLFPIRYMPFAGSP